MADEPTTGLRDTSLEIVSADEDAAESKTRRRFHLKLSSLYLDPNNYRFIHSEHYRGLVPDEKVFAPPVQAQTRRLLLGEQLSQIQDLLASIRENGWLDMEPIQVRQIDTRYLVVEGNRRVATLKYLQDQHQNGGEIGNLDPAIFEKVPVARTAETDPLHHLIVMGLHHISGKRQWPAMNQAILMRDLQSQHHKNPAEICRSLAVSKREFNLSLRSLALCQAYRDSDYGDDFRADKFNLFREVLKSPALRDWIGWDDDTVQATHRKNRELLFSWFSKQTGGAEDDALTEEERESAQASSTLEAVITTGPQVRELARIIEDPEAVRLLEETRSLQEASLSSGVLAKSAVDAALQRAEQAANVLFARSVLLESQDRSRIEVAVDRLNGILMASGKRGAAHGLSQSAWSAYNEIRTTHFDRVCVQRYRGLRDVILEQPGRVNLIAGINNAGKTSLLEAVFLLARQSDSRALLEVLQRRSRTDALPDAERLTLLLPQSAALSGHFDGRDTTLSWESQSEPDDEQTDRATFVRQIKMESRYEARSQSSTTILRKGLTPSIRTKGDNRILCPAHLTSPFLADRQSLLSAHDASLRLGKKDQIVDFLRDKFAPQLSGIERADAFASGFVVREQARAEPLDLSSYGDGMQRAFHIAMLFAATQAGVLLIDEFENAIHARALVPFTLLLKALAREFQVQVFLSTHSDEVIEAWSSEEVLADVVGYGLRRATAGEIEAVRFDGQRLHQLRQAFGFDLRGLQ